MSDDMFKAASWLAPLIDDALSDSSRPSYRVARTNGGQHVELYTSDGEKHAKVGMDWNIVGLLNMEDKYGETHATIYRFVCQDCLSFGLFTCSHLELVFEELADQSLFAFMKEDIENVRDDEGEKDHCWLQMVVSQEYGLDVWLKIDMHDLKISGVYVPSTRAEHPVITGINLGHISSTTTVFELRNILLDSLQDIATALHGGWKDMFKCPTCNRAVVTGTEAFSEEWLEAMYHLCSECLEKYAQYKTKIAQLADAAPDDEGPDYVRDPDGLFARYSDCKTALELVRQGNASELADDVVLEVLGIKDGSYIPLSESDADLVEGQITDTYAERPIPFVEWDQMEDRDKSYTRPLTRQEEQDMRNHLKNMNLGDY